MPHLRFNLNGQARTRQLTKEVTIGRSSTDSDWIVNEPTISRRHCRIARDRETGAWLIEDLGSRGGTLLGGWKVDRPSPLHDGDEIRIGAALLTFFTETEPAASSDQRASTGLSEQDLLQLLNDIPSSGLAQLASSGEKPVEVPQPPSFGTSTSAAAVITATPTLTTSPERAPRPKKSFGSLIGEVDRHLDARDSAKAAGVTRSWRGKLHVPRAFGVVAIVIATIAFTALTVWLDL